MSDSDSDSEKKARKEGKPKAIHLRSSPLCKACGDLRPDAFSGPYKGRREYRTEFGYIKDAAAAGCISCAVLAVAIAELADPLGTAACLFMSVESLPRSALRLDYLLGSSMVEHCIELYALPDARTRWDAIGWECRRNVSRHSGSPECMDLVRLWLRECDELHPNCPPRPGKLPKRVIYVGGSEPRLHISNGEFAHYVALSHRWGDHRPMVTEKTTLEDLKLWIPYGYLPRQFQDAVTVTRTLGVDYLWIDSLCIVQDDKRDWESHASKMGQIYANAYITIAADDAADARAAILGPRDGGALRHIAIPCPGLNDGEAVTVYARTRADVRADTDRDRNPVVLSVAHGRVEAARGPSPLDTRGWTFQERLLAPRTLHYTASELVFECREELRCECSPVRDTDKYETSQLFKNQGRGGGFATFNWSSVVENFTDRRLTVETDRLFAIAGVAAAMSPPYRQVQYLMGMWESELEASLLWEVRDDAAESRRNRADYAPTWSWASVTGAVRCKPKGSGDVFDMFYNRWAEVVDVDVSRDAENPYGPGSGSITLRGRVGPATITRLETSGKRPSIRFPTWFGFREEGVLRLDNREAPEVHVGERVTLLVNLRRDTDGPSGTIFSALDCTVLKAVKGSRGTFRRVGRASFFVDQAGFKLWRGSKVADVRII